MKKLINALLVLLVLGGLAWALWHGFTHRAAPAEEEPAAGEKHEDEEKPEAFVVTLEKEKWQALALEMDQLEAAELAPRRRAFGRVLDPTPLVALEGDLAAAEAALAASRAEHERAQKLLAAGENASRKTVEAAEAQFRADQIKSEGLRRRAQLEWGAAFATLDAAARHGLVEEIVALKVALVRVDLLPGDALAQTPRRAQLLVLNREETPILAETIFPAMDVDPKTQAQGYVVRVDGPPFPLLPGVALTAWLELPEKPRPGFALPRAAVLRHDGRTWVYVQEEEEKFVRKPVALESPLDGAKGWFIPAEGGLTADDLVVVTGAQALLSEELKAQGGAEPD